MAGTIDLLQRCFAGAEIHDDALWLNPHWPKQLGQVKFAMSYRGHVVTVTITDRSILVSSGSGNRAPVQVGCQGRLRELSNSQTLKFELWPRQG